MPPGGAGEGVGAERAAELYQEAFELLDVDLTEEERMATLGEREDEIREEARRRIQEGLEVLSEAASAETVAWEFEDESARLFPESIHEHIGPSRNAVRLASWQASEIGAEDPEGALDLVETIFAVSRHTNDRGMLIHLLTSIATESIAYSALTEVAGDWEQRHRDRLIDIIRNQAADRSVREAIAREGEFVVSRMRDALFSIPETASLAELVRISSVTMLPGETWIGLEHVGLNVSLRLEPGETRHGIKLVSFDPEHDQAVIRSDHEEAVIHLQARQVAPLNPEEFFELLGLEADGNVAAKLVEEDDVWFDAPNPGDDLTGEESDAEVALMMLREMERVYEFIDPLLAEPFGALPTDRDRDAELEFPEETNEVIEYFASSVARVRQSEQAARTYREMVLTALRLLDDPDAPIPDDPFSPAGAELLTVSIDEDAVEVRSQHHMGGDRTHSFRLER